MESKPETRAVAFLTQLIQPLTSNMQANAASELANEGAHGAFSF